MVHPPPLPEGWAPWFWRQHVVVAAALVVARGSEPWPGSRRREALHALLFGATDWTTTAAIAACGELQRREQEPRAEIREWYDRLLARPLTPIHFMCVEEPLVECMLQLEGLSEEQRAALRERRRQNQ